MNFPIIRIGLETMRNLPRSAARRWPALAVATVAAAIPMTVAVAQDFPGFNTFGPSAFSMKNVGSESAAAALTADGQAIGGTRNGVNATGQIGVDATGTQFGLRASAQPGTDATGLRAEAGKTAISATSFDATAIVGNGLQTGVRGQSTSSTGTGVQATGGSAGIGLAATGQTAITANGDTAVNAQGTTRGIQAQGKSQGVSASASAASGSGVFAFSTGSRGVGVDGAAATFSDGVGGRFSGGRAQIELLPAATVGTPKVGQHERGELFLDAQGDLYLCKDGGTPGRWVKLS